MANKDLSMKQINTQMTICFFVGLVLLALGLPAGVYAFLLFRGEIQLPEYLPFNLGRLQDDSDGNIPLVILSIAAVLFLCLGFIILGQAAHLFRLRKYTKKQNVKDKTSNIVSEL